MERDQGGIDMKNGIIINGIAYKVRKQSITPMAPFVCKKCDLKRKCGESTGASPCLIFEDKKHEVYFTKMEQ